MAVRLIHERWGSSLSEAERQAADIVVDLAAERTTCPACLEEFDPGSALGRCPECGLVFG